MSDSPPWSHGVPWSAVGTDEQELRLVADAETRARVARFLRVEGIETLEASVRIRGWFDGMELTGRVNGVARRACGVSLEAFDEVIDAPLHGRMVPPGSPHAADDGEVVVDLEADDPPDVVEGDRVDVAAFVTEIFALALDPFPRKAGAVFVQPAESAPLSPFAVLRASSPK